MTMSPIAPYSTGANPGIFADAINAMTEAQLRTALYRVADLLNTGRDEPPPDGSLVIVGTSGGHQDRPYREAVYVRSDDPDVDTESGSMSAQQRADGDWYRVGDDREHRLTWGELNWDDDPPCDRGDVAIDGHWLHDTAVAAAILGGAA